METTKEEGARPVHNWATGLEPQAFEQAKKLAKLPFIHPHGIALMPDAHMGIGSTVGSVIATYKAIVPAAVGVDIGCGMMALRTSLTASDMGDNLQTLFHQIERDVPLGAGGKHQGRDADNIEGAWKHDEGLVLLNSNARQIFDKHPKLETRYYMNQMGSLGSGNHFIEICLDEHDQVWVMLHSGSRGVGNTIGRYFIEKAKLEMEKYFITLPDQDLAYFPESTEGFNDYIQAMTWAQDYAMLNREYMMDAVISAMRRQWPNMTTEESAVNCHHNYCTCENHFNRNAWVTRKGAIRAREGDMGIIPGSMGQRSYIVRGKGNTQSYNSASHGAGRAMSRSEARRRFSVEDLVRETEGVVCRKTDDVLDELPSGYKNIDEVMANQADLVDVVATLKQILCVKGA